MSEAQNQRLKKFWFCLSLIINLGFLGVFKYYNFFAESFAEGFSNLGIHFSPWTLKVILPVGISFYTFHGISYIIDVYKERIKAEKNFIEYSVFVSFFPLLVAGPIERATHLLPQIKQQRKFDYTKAVDGLRQILWGLFKKIVIADRCAVYADSIFNNYAEHSGSTLLLGAIFFAFQIYGDFSGYSDIALGTAKLFGIDLLRNFSFPYFSRDIAEFWRRWHISLSSWFKDYVYIPLGGSKGGIWLKIRNTFVIFILSGFWHGANWTFIVWGILNAIYFLPLLLSKNNRNHLEIVAQGKYLPSIKELTSMLFTFSLTVLAWIFFRSVNVTQAIDIISEIFSGSLFTVPSPNGKIEMKITIILVALFVLLEWLGREKEYPLANLNSILNKPLRWSLYVIIIAIMGLFMQITDNNTFIYFQF